MKILLVAINAKFIHSSLAIRSLQAFCHSEFVHTKEFTINHEADFIMAELYKEEPDVLCFSVYIWNIDMVRTIASAMKKIMPHLTIVVGGPEVSFEYDDLFLQAIDIVVIGEGEKTFRSLVDYFVKGEGELSQIDGIAFSHIEPSGKRTTIQTAATTPLALADIPFVYEDLSALDHRILYYESARGCPFQCQYCLSGAEQGVRFLSPERVKGDLTFFLAHNVRQVKFVDRTFNCNKEHARMIWQFLIDNDNGVTNFHFEISADLLDDKLLLLLQQARAGLFQFEIGIQSTNGDTLQKITRKTNLAVLFDNVIKIKQLKNIHVHLDLIAGLPGETYQSFRKSFDDVFRLYPEQLQLGFLKVLKGAGLRADAAAYGLIYRDNAPYEILLTNDLSYPELTTLRQISELVELYYNSGKCVQSLRYILSFNDSPFDFFERFGAYWVKNEYHHVSHNKMTLYTILYEFCVKTFTDVSTIGQMLKFDILLNDNVKTVPYWLDAPKDEAVTLMARRFFHDRDQVLKTIGHLSAFTATQLGRMCRIEAFDVDMLNWQQHGESIKKVQTLVLFDYYGERDVNGFAHVYSINA